MRKLGIVCEGGGTRGAYTAGVLTWFLENNIPIDYTVGISAGAFTLAQFVSKQPERMKSTSTTWVADKHYMGIQAFKDEGAFIGINFVFDKLQETEPIDFDTLYNNPTEFEFGLFNLVNGELEFYPKDTLKDNFELFKASCKLPIMSKVANINNNFYLDGGVKNMIPIYRAHEMGVKHNFVILTKPDNYIRKPENKWEMRLISLLYKKKFPKLIENLLRRHTEFADELKYIYASQKEGKTLVLRPSIDLNIKRTTKDVTLLNKMYQLGIDDCKMREKEIMELVNKAIDANE